MSTRLHPYPEVKDPGVKWLGRIPAHWDVRKLKYIASVRASNVDKKTVSGERQVKLCNYVNVYYNDHITGSLDFMIATATEEQINKFRLAPGDVCVTKDSEEWNDIAVPALVTEDVPDLVCGYHLAIIRPRPDRILGRYLARCFAARGINDQYRVEANGITRFGLGTDSLKCGLFPVPPLDEQIAIADFLDRQTGKLDALVKKKEQLIELLREKRTSIATKVVIEGLDSSARFVASGIEAVQRIPEVWTVKQCNLLFKERDERGYPELPIMEVSIHSGVSLRTFSTDKIEQKSDDLASYKRAVRGDLAFNKMRMWQGAVGVAPVDGLVSPDYTVAMPLKDVCARYYELLFRTSVFKTEINRHSHGIVPDRNRLYWDSFKQIKVLVPPYKEQLKIVEWVDERTARIDALASKIRGGIDRLREYRTALITAAVTGQIDVRQVQAKTAHSAVKLPPVAFRRAVFAAEIIEKCYEQQTFGHVKFQKILHLAEYHLGLQDFESNYYRQAAGPYDNQMIRSVDSQVERQKWFRHTGTRYIPLENAGRHRKYFDQYWREYSAGLDHILCLFKTFNSERCEIVSTLYAVWNDFLLAGASFVDEAIVNDAIAWHPEKQRIERERWFKALGWMREQGLVPRGTGKPIKIKPKPTSA